MEPNTDHTAIPSQAEPPAARAATEVAPAAEVPGESPDALRAALALKSEEAERLQDRLLRLQAEFENYKKRTAREKADHLRFAHEGLILDFLPVLDNLERAINAARVEVGSTPLLEGVEMIARLFQSALERAGVRPMESLGQPFDPAYHQAVAQVDVCHGDAQLVVEEIQKGYSMEGRVLRPAMVKVSRPAPSHPEGGSCGGDT